MLEKIIKPYKSKIVLLKLSIYDEKSLVFSRKLTDQYRNMKGIEEKTGVHDFYLGFSFLSVFLSNGTFFLAPLFHYPVRLGSINQYVGFRLFSV
ncbi:DUF4011 domain-containing protein [Cytobacillus sp. Hz8]|uniref:DUF4011 domain-containing protein n=1 Tax=Cytobacillus sp. Hz8 TaxID=3347168 RepID=UPI0035D6360E